MVRSVLKLTSSDFKKIQNKMITKTSKQLEIRDKFGLDQKERVMLIELENLLSIFEWMTNEFQGIFT
jgi:hypothetical protein